MLFYPINSLLSSESICNDSCGARITNPTSPLPPTIHPYPYSPHFNNHKLSPTQKKTATISFLRHFFTRAPSPATMSATKTKVQSIIDENPVAVFSKSYCPYCRQAKELLSQSGAKFYAIELDQVDDGSAIQSTLGEMTGQTTVPNIFIAKEHIGGNSDLQAKKNNLKTLLKDAGAL
ncbi:hypothetical protein HBI25_134030 [Parastagonospora nodorum]|nr:hypothetical protein HBH54_086950 [Parastagonospora nodorum]KAH3972747.1 hypothetical protein HBH51_101600 [Parastagonospora nodorum]KAH4012967.1 hypothetical protein HBI13_185190 [Parastagonospora nodorum]KAH4084264.1 hypothetical protein HBH48_166910 [Parastagonospora nodorum]KAH4171709.1 hypothetical protein HBH44_024970 [Parastagonospora nodorum]